MKARSILIVAIAVSLSVDLPLPQLGHEGLTLDELLLVAALALVGPALWLRVHMDRTMIALAAADLMAQSTDFLRGQALNYAAAVRVLILWLSFAILITSAKDVGRGPILLLGRVVHIVACVSAALVLMQAIHLAPNFSLTTSGELTLKTRPTGLQGDANFAAYTLVLGLALVPSMRASKRVTRLSILLLSSAILATESRMGVVLAAVVVVSHVRSSGVSWIRVWSYTLVGALTLLLASIGISATTQRDNPLSRFSELSTTAANVASGAAFRESGLREDSGTERAAVAAAAFGAWRSSPWLGVGQDGLRQKILVETGAARASHNGYLDRMGSGGIAGTLVIAILLLVAARELRGWARSNVIDSLPGRLLLICLLAQLFLNVSVWPPVAIAAAARAARRRRHRDDGRTAHNENPILTYPRVDLRRTAI